MSENEYKSPTEEKTGGKAGSKAAVIAAVVIALLIAGFFGYTKAIQPAQRYNEAAALLDAGKYEEAMAAFEAMDGYKDSADRIEQCKAGIRDREYEGAVELLNAGRFEEARAAFEAMDGYRDSADRIKDCETGILEDQFKAAVALMEAGKYREAIEAFSAIEHKDSEAMIKACREALTDEAYGEAVALMAKGKYVDAAEILKDLDYKDSAEKYAECKKMAAYELTNVGDTILFGRYEQDNNHDNGPEAISWRVLDKKDGNVLIISEMALDKSPFFAIYWKRSYIPGFLNNTFLDDFTAEEKAQLVEITVTADRHPKKPETDQGADVQNKVFLLSVDEADRYFKDNQDRVCYATEYLKHECARDVGDNKMIEADGRCDWWLRTAYSNWSNGAIIANIDPSGGVNMSTHDCRMGLRPACWIRLAED